MSRKVVCLSLPLPLPCLSESFQIRHPSWVGGGVLEESVSVPLLVLALLVGESFPRSIPRCQLTRSRSIVQQSSLRCKFSQLVSHHLFRYIDLLIALAIMYGKAQTNKIRKYSRSTLLRTDWRCSWWRRIGLGEIEVNEIRS